MQLVESVHEFLKTVDRSRRALRNQIERAALSIPANIAEGYGRSSRKQYLQFLSISAGSLRELETLLTAAQRTSAGQAAKADVALAVADETGRILYGLRRSLGARSP